MSVRSIFFGSVCSAWLAATAAVAGVQAAENSSVDLAAAAYRALTEGDRIGAIARYSEAIESRELPTDALANALLNRALAYQQTGQYQDAVDDYAAALRIDALSAKLRATALYNRGLAYQKLARPALAIEDFTSALFLDSEFSYCYYSRGIALRDSGQYLFALSDFEKARRYNHPQPHLVYYGEALVYEALKRPDEAAKSLRKALALKPDFVPAKQHLSGLGFDAPAAETQQPESDDLTTGSISLAAGSRYGIKSALPEAVKPPENLLPALATQSVAHARPKKYTDRIPAEVSADLTLAAAAPAAERVVAIESVPAAAESGASPSAGSVPGAEPREENPPMQGLSGWSVQLSSARNEKMAWSIWDKLKTKHRILADHRPIVVRADLGTKGIFYRLRLAGFADSTSASAICSKLKAKGLSCFVSRINS
jgi:tetratricopeptide (TPR) repeat protein